MSRNFPLGSCFIWILYFSMLKNICGFTSAFMDICSTTSQPFGFTYRSKRPTLDILKFLFTTLSNQDNKFVFIRVDEDGSLARSSWFMKTCHTMNIIVQTKDGYESSLNSKSESPNKILDNIKISLLLYSSHKKEPWCFAYQYAIWISRRTDNSLRVGVPYLLWHGTRPSYKHIKIWGVRFYITNGRVTIKNLDDRSHWGYFMGDAATTGVILYWKQINLLLSTKPIVFGLINIIIVYP